MSAVPLEWIAPSVFACVAALYWLAVKALDRWPGEQD